MTKPTTTMFYTIIDLCPMFKFCFHFLQAIGGTKLDAGGAMALKPLNLTSSSPSRESLTKARGVFGILSSTKSMTVPTTPPCIEVIII